MLTRAAIPRLSHIIKSVPKDSSCIEWIKLVDDADLSNWLNCVRAITLDPVLTYRERKHLSSSLDLPPLVWWCWLTINDEGS